MATKVINIYSTPIDHVYIGRLLYGQPWGYGNPFKIGRDGSRQQVIWKHKMWLKFGNTFDNPDATPERRIWVITHVHELKDQTLGCVCKPGECHGDYLADLADGTEVI